MMVNYMYMVIICGYYLMVICIICIIMAYILYDIYYIGS